MLSRMRNTGDNQHQQNDTAIDTLVSELLGSSAGAEMCAVLMGGSVIRCEEVDADSDRREAADAVSTSLLNIKTKIQFCVALADAWSGLASIVDGDQSDRFAEGARLAYAGVLAVAAAHASGNGRRVLRAKERRRLERAGAAAGAAPRAGSGREARPN